MMKLLTRPYLTPLLLSLLISACAGMGNQSSLYQQLGGQPAIDTMVDRLIVLHAQTPEIQQYFEQSNLQRFRDKLSEFICFISDGPCEYSGDSMALTHGGMYISDREFNTGVDLMIQAMDDSGISLSARNQLLARLARLRSDIIEQ